MELLLEHVGQGFVKMLLLSMPSVLTAAAIGLVVGILQAVTQVQEQTIAAAPKILAVFLVVIAMGNFSTRVLTEYFQESANLAFNVITHEDDFVLPASGIYERSSFFDEKKFFGEEKPGIKDALNSPGKPPYGDNQYKQSYTGTGNTPNPQPNIVEKTKIYSGR